MNEQVYNQYYDTGGNYHWIGVHSGEHIVRKGEKMSAYSDWKCGAITEEEYKDYCRWEDDRDEVEEEE